MFRVIAQYQGHSPELEEEIYFVTRRRPDQAGEQIVTPSPATHEPDVEGGLHHPKEIHQQHRFLSYTVPDVAAAERLAWRLEGIDGVSVKVVDDRPAPAPEEPAANEPAAAAPAADEAAAAEEPAAAEVVADPAVVPEGDAAHFDAD